MDHIHKNLRKILENSLKQRFINDEMGEEDLVAVRNNIRESLVNLFAMEGHAVDNMKIKLLLDRDISEFFEKVIKGMKSEKK